MFSIDLAEFLGLNLVEFVQHGLLLGLHFFQHRFFSVSPLLLPLSERSADVLGARADAALLSLADVQGCRFAYVQLAVGIRIVSGRMLDLLTGDVLTRSHWLHVWTDSGSIGSFPISSIL